MSYTDKKIETGVWAGLSNRVVGRMVNALLGDCVSFTRTEIKLNVPKEEAIRFIKNKFPDLNEITRYRGIGRKTANMIFKWMGEAPLKLTPIQEAKKRITELEEENKRLKAKNNRLLTTALAPSPCARSAPACG